MKHNSLYYEHIDTDNIPHQFMFNAMIDALADSLPFADPTRWIDNIEIIRNTAHHMGYSTVEMVASSLESVIARDSCKRVIACYMDAIRVALEMDLTFAALSLPISPSMSLSASPVIILRQNQEALLASLALRMHG